MPLRQNDENDRQSHLSRPHLSMSMGLEPTKPDWPPLMQAEAISVLEHFPEAGSLQDLLWHSPRPFSAASTLRTDRGEFFLKRHHRTVRDAAGLEEEHAFIAHLRGKGLPVARVLRTRTGTSALSAGEWTYELHGRMPGLDLYRDALSWTPFRAPGHAFAAGAMLARLHLASEGFSAPARKVQPLISSASIVSARDPVTALAGFVAARPGLEQALAHWPVADALLARLTSAPMRQLSAALRALPPLWTHGDWHASNLLWSDGGDVAGVMDFGLSDRTTAIFDLATAIERGGIEWLALEKGREAIDFAGIAALLEGYSSLRPLSAPEKEILPLLLPVAHVDFALSEADYFWRITRSPENTGLALVDYLTGHMEWFEGSDGQALLEFISAEAG